MGLSSRKIWLGRYFEDFSIGQEISHAGALTATESMATVYRSLTGIRFAAQCSEPFARSIGFRGMPLDDVFVFKIVFGHSVKDISMHAVATLGYGGCVFGAPVYAGDTLSSQTVIVGLDPGPSRDTGLVRVRTTGCNQHDEMVVTFTRWVTVRRRAPFESVGVVAEEMLPPPLSTDQLMVPARLETGNYDTSVSGSTFMWDDYQPGERIDHVDGCTIEEAEAMMLARLYQNTAPPHYNANFMASTDFRRRIVFVGHIVGLARSLSYNGLSNVFRLAGLNRARHLQATFAGTTVYAWSQVLEKLEIPGRTDIGALRLRTIATRDRTCGDFPEPPANGPPGDFLLDLDYVGLIPRKDGQKGYKQ